MDQATSPSRLGTPDEQSSSITHEKARQPSQQPFRALCSCSICALAVQYAEGAAPLPPGALPPEAPCKSAKQDEQPQRPGRKKGVLPGVSAQGYTLRLAVLKELAGSSPLRVALAGFMSLLQKHQGLTSGSMPVLPGRDAASAGGTTAPAAAEGPKDEEEQTSGRLADQDVNTVNSTPDSASSFVTPARAPQGVKEPSAGEVIVQSSPGAADNALGGNMSGERPTSRRSSISTRPHLAVDASPGRSLAQDGEMLGFVEQQAVKFPHLQRWVKLQLATNAALRDLNSGSAGTAGMLLERAWSSESCWDYLDQTPPALFASMWV